MASTNSLVNVLAAARSAMPKLLFISFFINVLMLAGPIYMVQVYDRVLSSRQLETLLLLTLMLAAAIAIYAMLEAIRGWMLQRLAVWVEQQGFESVFQASMQSSLSGATKGSEPLRHLEEVQSFIAHNLKSILDLPFVPLFFIAAFYLHVWIGVTVAVAAVILFFLALFNDRVTRSASFVYGQAASRSNAVVGHSLRHADVIHAMGMERSVISKWFGMRSLAQKAQQAAGDKAATFTALSKYVRTFTQSLVLGVGAMVVIWGEMSTSLIIAGTIIAGRALGPIDQILGSWRRILTVQFAYKELVELDRLSKPRAQRSVLPPPPQGDLVVSDLNFMSPINQKLILKDVSFDVRPGEVLVILGPSGAGKTTLFRTLIGAAKATSGQIELSGMDLSHWDPEYLGKFIGFLPQEVGLFPGSIRDNIARMDPNPDDEAVYEAAEVAGILPLINSLPEGFDTIIGPEGGYLSGGQAQRVGLARALYSKPPILVLDEPTAHLDQVGEAQFKDAIALAKAWKAAVIYITHTQSLIDVADKMLVLVDGKVKMFGSVKEVKLGLLQQRSEEAKQRREQARLNRISNHHDDDDDEDDDDDYDDDEDDEYHEQENASGDQNSSQRR